eukprot:CAMPEP_0202686524 /NCGR_PEP_ID=MMETSP1385-20130828/2275_1 /ASSEMBLY_ACC=CAM_ASM_000861 /TAXON_ID=933848 /ORGANISM="Elphidium margaritaceum" /LENGTH=113 /DNA_ID=CAMNT_0049341113 /DNA_START=119 /DNA_END=460 /DNA_ORIENTATION=-
MQMSQSGASLQNYNNELVKCLQDLKSKRDAVHKEMSNEEREKSRVQKQLAELTEQLHRLNESISQKQQAKNEYDKTIQETEAAYMKILESSQTLLHVLKRESQNLVKKTTPRS